ncbi:MAG TPA: menaquinone biosynthesis protein [Terriglobia bacterium]|nr:menaquinone biosynthesis protein [Terriglobia bacterium]
MPALRLSVVQYLNTVPLIWGMLHGEQRGQFELQFTVPSGCADAIAQRQADVGIVPSIEYQRLDGVEILPGMSIASKREVKSVLLLSKTPLAKVQSVALDESSRTSTALVRILMHKFYARRVHFLPAAPEPGEMLRQADAALLIGDPALAYSGPAKVYDLAREWRKFTGLPFVFAVWMGHSDANLSRRTADFAASLEFGLDHLDDIAAEYAPKLGLTPSAVKVYLTQNIDYSLDEENRQGLKLFYKLAHEVGIIPVEKELLFA